jgi:hypothetical protein
MGLRRSLAEVFANTAIPFFSYGRMIGSNQAVDLPISVLFIQYFKNVK